MGPARCGWPLRTWRRTRPGPGARTAACASACSPSGGLPTPKQQWGGFTRHLDTVNTKRRKRTTIPVRSPASNLAMARSSDFWRLLLILWQTSLLRSMERPRSWTWRWRSRVTYRLGAGVLMYVPRAWHSWRNLKKKEKTFSCFACVLNNVH